MKNIFLLIMGCSIGMAASRVDRLTRDSREQESLEVKQSIERLHAEHQSLLVEITQTESKQEVIETNPEAPLIPTVSAMQYLSLKSTQPSPQDTGETQALDDEYITIPKSGLDYLNVPPVGGDRKVYDHVSKILLFSPIEEFYVNQVFYDILSQIAVLEDSHKQPFMMMPRSRKTGSRMSFYAVLEESVEFKEIEAQLEQSLNPLLGPMRTKWIMKNMDEGFFGRPRPQTSSTNP